MEEGRKIEKMRQSVDIALPFVEAAAVFRAAACNASLEADELEQALSGVEEVLEDIREINARRKWRTLEAVRRLAELTPAETVVSIRFLSGRSVGQIAKGLGISPQAVSKSLRNAIRKCDFLRRACVARTVLARKG